jgi:hypothetical protein
MPIASVVMGSYKKTKKKTMRDKINEEVLCVLRSSQLTNQIEIEYVEIENPLSKPLEDFENLCKITIRL